MLRWEPQGSNNWYAYSGELIVAMVVQIKVGPSEGRFAWSISVVHMKWTGQPGGDSARVATAKTAVERNWQKWLDRAGLAPESDRMKRRTLARKEPTMLTVDPSPADAVIAGKSHDRLRAIAPTLVASLIADVPPPYPTPEPAPLTRKQRQEVARKQRQQQAQAARDSKLEEVDEKKAPKVQRDAVTGSDGATVRAPRVERDGLVFKRSTPLVHLAKRSEGMEAPTITAAHVKAAKRLADAWEMAGEGIGVGASNFAERTGTGVATSMEPPSLGFQLDAQREIASAHAWLGALWPAIYAVVIQGMDVTSYAAKAKKDRKLALGYVQASLDRLVEFYKPRVDLFAIIAALDGSAPGIRSAIVVPNQTDAQSVDNDGPSRA